MVRYMSQMSTFEFQHAPVVFLDDSNCVKLGDFGLARFYQKRRRSDYTNRVITLWYRPPELLFGTTVYGPEVDMWSAG